MDNLIPTYVDSLCREIELLAKASKERLLANTIFFGGGTPSLLTPRQLEHVLRALDDHFDLMPQAEITLEANPGTLSRDYLHTLRSLGINRLSLGMQSAHPGELALLERGHDFEDVVQAVYWTRKVGLDNLNLDLIFGLPSQEMKNWQQTVNLALDLRPKHLSLYALTLEHGTPMKRWVSKGLLPDTDADLAAEMYTWASDRLEMKGYEQYEISNWAREGFGEDWRCRHNLQYWRNLPYLGLGAGAHGYAKSVRTANVLSPTGYIQHCQMGSAGKFPRTPATASTQLIDRQTEMGETMMMGLRLTQEGVSSKAFEQRFGKSLNQVYGSEIDDLLKNELVEWCGEAEERLRLTSHGRLLGNQVFMQFI